MRQTSAASQALASANSQQSWLQRLGRWFWPGAVIVALLLGYAVGHRIAQNATTAQQASTVQQNTLNTQNTVNTQNSQQVTSVQPAVKSLTLTTLFSYHSSGNKQTQVFTAPKAWSLQWQCNPASYSIKQYNFVVAIYGADGTLIDPAALNTICKAGNTTGTVQEQQGGKVYLDVFSQGDWTLNVQQLK